MTDTIERKVIHVKKPPIADSEQIGSRHDPAIAFFPRLNEMYTGTPGEPKVIPEVHIDRKNQTIIDKISRDELVISRVSTRQTGRGPVITIQSATVIQRDGLPQPFYIFRFRSGHENDISHAKIVESTNTPYARHQVELLIATTEQAYNRQMGSASKPPRLHDVEHTVFEHAHKHASHHNPHGLGLSAVHIIPPAIIRNS